ncbi:MAG: hypothetical protein JO295_09385 [Verrucomicrobia bacterium]|nr:hypothetical protein [Verrucomicrobiota bacterium]
MHRSGTSAVAGTLSALGVDLGCDLMPPAGGNPFGYFEHQGVVALNEELLATAGSAWHRPLTTQGAAHAVTSRPDAVAHVSLALHEQFHQSPLWGLKDPRLCRLLPVWLRLLADLRSEPCAVIVVRHPQEVVDSLYRRDGIAREEGYSLWLQHVLAAEAATRSAKIPRAFVTYEAILADWRTTADKVAHALGLTWPIAPAAAATRIESFLYPKFHHEKTGPADLCPAAPRHVFQLLTRLAEKGENPRVHRQLDQFHQAFEGAIDLLPAVLPFAPAPPLTFEPPQSPFEEVAFQIFFPRPHGYGEDYSLLHRYRSGLGWRCLQSRLPLSDINLDRGLRLDPASCVALVEIGRVAIISELDGRTVWSAHTLEDFDRFQISGTALRLPHERHLVLFSHGIDPQIYLPRIELPKTNEPLRLEIWMQARTGEQGLADWLPPWLESVAALRTHSELTAAQCAELGRELSRAHRDLEAANIAGTESARQLAEVRAQLEGVQTACDAAAALVQTRDAEILATRTELAELRAALSAGQEAIRLTEAELLASRADVARLHEELTDLQTERQRFEEELAGSRTELNKTQAILAGEQGARQTAETKLKEALARFEAGQERLTTTEATLAAVQTNLAEAEQRWVERSLQEEQGRTSRLQSKLAGFWRAFFTSVPVSSHDSTPDAVLSHGVERQGLHRAFKPAHRGVEVNDSNGHH